jgi:hypothetical protein
MNVDDEEKYESLKKVAKKAARTLHGAAMLVLAGQTPPDIIIYGEDFINGREELGAMDDGQ